MEWMGRMGLGWTDTNLAFAVFLFSFCLNTLLFLSIYLYDFASYLLGIIPCYTTSHHLCVGCCHPMAMVERCMPQVVTAHSLF